MVDTLAAHLATAGSGEDQLVFHIAGRAVARAMAAKYMRTATKHADVTATWHDLRHNHASVLLAEGVSPSQVAERLGPRPQDTVGHLRSRDASDDDRVRSIVDATLGGSAEDWLRTEAV